MLQYTILDREGTDTKSLFKNYFCEEYDHTNLTCGANIELMHSVARDKISVMPMQHSAFEAQQMHKAKYMHLCSKANLWHNVACSSYDINAMQNAQNGNTASDENNPTQGN